VKRKRLIPGNKELRRRAEQRLAESKPPEIPEVKGSAERLIHHLQVHQVELELQNEELAESRNALEESLAKYTELYEFAPIGYLTVRLDGAIEKANLAAASLLRIERAHLINNLLARFVSSNDLDKLNRFLAGIAEGRDRVTCELGLGNGRTPRRWARLIAGAPMPRSGGLVNKDSVFLLAMEDITQRHQQESELAEVQEDLRAAVRARDNLMAIVSHDLLSPLSAIRLSAELLAATPPQGERRQNRKQLDVIFRAAEGMRRLIGDLLQATAIDTGNFNVDPQPEDVPSILQEVRSAFEPLLASRGIAWKWKFPPTFRRSAATTSG
jgi:two-component system CheB/CheR fusion protein